MHGGNCGARNSFSRDVHPAAPPLAPPRRRRHRLALASHAAADPPSRAHRAGQHILRGNRVRRVPVLNAQCAGKAAARRTRRAPTPRAVRSRPAGRCRAGTAANTDGWMHADGASLRRHSRNRIASAPSCPQFPAPSVAPLWPCPCPCPRPFPFLFFIYNSIMSFSHVNRGIFVIMIIYSVSIPALCVSS